MDGTVTNSKKTLKNIVENLNDVVKTTKTRKSGKGYLKTGKDAVSMVKMPDVDSKIGSKLGQYADKQVKGIKAASKKVKENVESEA